MAPDRWIGVMGGAKVFDKGLLQLGYQVGQEIAAQGRNLITGATTGIPYAAAAGAKAGGAMVIGISPASSFEDHVLVYGKPLDNADCIIYTGMGVDGRSGILTRSVLGLIFIGGELGTLHEFCSAWLVGQNALGIIQGTGGLTEAVYQQMQDRTNWGSRVIFGEDPGEIVSKVCSAVDELYAQRLANLSGTDICSQERALLSGSPREQHGTQSN